MKYYIRLGNVKGDDVARTFTLLEALYVAQAESSNKHGRYYGDMLTIFHNRKIVAYVQGHSCVRDYHDTVWYGPESFVEKYGKDGALLPQEQSNELFDLYAE